VVARIRKVCLVIKLVNMNRPKRDILVVVKNQFLSERAIDREVEYLNEILRIAESNDQFCTAHELVIRNRITQRPRKILKAIRFVHLPAFRFLLNKN
jgi:hypothetical protein